MNKREQKKQLTELANLLSGYSTNADIGVSADTIRHLISSPNMQTATSARDARQNNGSLSDFNDQLNHFQSEYNKLTRVNQIERHYGTINQGVGSLPVNRLSTGTSNVLENLGNSNNRNDSDVNLFNRAIRAIGRYTEQLRQDFAKGSYLNSDGSSKISAHELQTRLSDMHRGQRYLHNPFVSRIRNPDSHKMQYSLSPGIRSNINSAYEQYRVGNALKNSNVPRDSAWGRSLKNSGITPAGFGLFAAKQMRAENKEQDRNYRPSRLEQQNPREIFRNYNDERAHSLNYLRDIRRRANRMNGFNGRLNRVRNMALRQTGTSITDKNWRYIKRRLRDALKGTKNRNGANRVESQEEGDLGRLRAARDSYNQFNRATGPSMQNMLDTLRNTYHVNTSGVNSNHEDTQSAALDRIENAAHNPDNSGERNTAQNYLSAREHYMALNNAIKAVQSQLNNFKDRINSATGAVSTLHKTLTTNPLEGANDPNATLFKYEPGSWQSMGQRMLGAGVLAHTISAGFNGLRQANGSGAQIRIASEPGINSQVLGNAINGATPSYHADNRLFNHLNQQGWRYGQTPEEMSQYEGALAGTRATGRGMGNAAINLARFSRDNNVNPQTTAQLFNTLGQSGGLGSTPGQVQNNTLDLSRQFAGMLQQNHLGAMGSQQAQGLNSIYSNMLGSGQTVTPNTAGNVMAMQSVLSHGAGGQVFQGQQGAQQLNAFSHGVGGAFNNMLIRNAFAGGMPQYGGQQGLYRLQMDMQEPLKHPTQLNNMIQGMANTGLGPSGTEDALTQMGLGPEAAKKVYRDAMSGKLTQNNLDRIKNRDRGTGKNTQRRTNRQYEQEGASSLDKIRAIDEAIKARTSEIYDALRNERSKVEGPMSTNGFGASTLSMLGGVGSSLMSGLPMMLFSALGGNPMGVSSMKGLFRAFRPKTFKALIHGAKGEKGLGRVRGAWKSYKSAYGLGKSPAKVAKGAKNADEASKGAPLLKPLVDHGRNLTHRVRSHIPKAIRRRIPHVNGPLANRTTRAIGRHMPRTSKAVSKIGSTIAKRPALFKGLKGAGHLAGRALDYGAPISGLWTAGHYLRRGRPIRALTGGLDSALSNSDIGLAGSALGWGAKKLHMNGLGNFIDKATNSPLHSLGKLFGMDNKANASTRKGKSRSEKSSTRRTRHSIFYWLARIDRLLPALAKKMEGFSDVDPSLAGNKGTNGSTETSGANGSSSSDTSSNGSTSNQPASATNSSVSKNLNRTGTDTSPSQSTAPFMASVTPEYVGARYHNNNNNSDDHSTHDSHNVYNNYIKAPSQNYLRKIADNSQQTADYFGHTHKTNWA